MIFLREWLFISPEIMLFVSGCVMLIIDSLSRKTTVKFYSRFTLFILGLALISCFLIPHGNNISSFYFSNSLIFNRFTIGLKIIILLSSIIAVFLAENALNNINQNNKNSGCYYALIIFSILGSLTLIASQNFLMLYLSLELLTLPLSILLALDQRTLLTLEAAVKFFLLSIIASALMLYGISLLYGATGSLDFSQITSTIQSSVIIKNNYLLNIGLLFILAGMVFKLGGAPFHFWVPDVYQISALPVILLISSGAKIAGFAMIVKILHQVLPDLSILWQFWLTLITILSMGFGNLIAISQHNVRRMIGYSSVAQMGYLLLGVLSSLSFGIAASLFYIIIYVLSTLLFFGLLLTLENLNNNNLNYENIDDFKGLSRKFPLIAFLLMLSLFSMAGIPPFAGFITKLTVLTALIQSHRIIIACIAVLLAVIGAFYYIRLIKAIYFDCDRVDNLEHVDGKNLVLLNNIKNNSILFILILLGFALLLFGIIPNSLLTLCQKLI